jgi:hypothetical protein
VRLFWPFPAFETMQRQNLTEVQLDAAEVWLRAWATQSGKLVVNALA